MRHVAACVLVAIFAALGSRGHGSPLQQSPHLRLKAAQIIELFDGAPRRVAFRIELEAPPVCDRAAPTYSFLIDADRMRSTGGLTRSFPELGIDAQIMIRCDVTAKRFVSTAGAVVVTAASGASPSRLEVVTQLDALPSQAFYWIAVAREGSRFVRLPEAGRVEGWRTLESWLH